MAYNKTEWENLPSENTPIDADSLNKIEDGIKTQSKYHQATAGSNGDFFIDIPNYTLEEGSIIYVSFPEATDGSSNARLSIDGGSNYIEFQMGSVNLTAEELEERHITCYYNGTTWEFVGTIKGTYSAELGGRTVVGRWSKTSCGTMTMQANDTTGQTYDSGTNNIVFTFYKPFSGNSSYTPVGVVKMQSTTDLSKVDYFSLLQVFVADSCTFVLRLNEDLSFAFRPAIYVYGTWY